MNAQTSISYRSRFPALANMPVTPGGYIRTCREAAGLTVKQVAEAIAVTAEDRLVARWDLLRLQRNEPGDYGRLVKALRDRAVFPFDFIHFAALAAETASYELGDVPGSDL